MHALDRPAVQGNMLVLTYSNPQHLFALRDRFKNEVLHHEGRNGRSCCRHSFLPRACVTPD